MVDNVTSGKEKNMMITMMCLLALVLAPWNTAAANRVTFYRDGTMLEQEASARKGVLLVPLAAGRLEGTLKISPAAGTTLLGVEIVPPLTTGKGAKELDALIENRRRLEDRLQALATREEIFTAAAKSQGGKAPRKTKTNPDPLQTIRQGTDFAIAQLEAVYTARRRTEQEIKRIDTSIAAARKHDRGADSNARITVMPANGSVVIRYATGETGWQPHYDLHLTSNGMAQLRLSARLKSSYPGYSGSVSTASWTENSAVTFPLQQSSLAAVASFTLPLAEEHYEEGITTRFSGRITNGTQGYLPPGESSLYKNGIYMGNFRFEGISSGRSRVIRIGI
jgi:hypothetical protein